MRSPGPLLLFLSALFPPLVPAAVIDRIAVVVGNQAITESEVLSEVRLTEFLNRQPLDVSPAARRAAAGRMVDQQLIAAEMKLDGFVMPAPADANPLLAQVEQRYPNAARFQAALAAYGLTEAELRRYLLWQVAILRFADTRFPTGLPEPSASRSQEPGEPAAADRTLEQWLARQRASTHIEFKPEAFQ